MALQEAQIESPETSARSAEPHLDHRQIASLAYALWQQRGGPEGSSEEDWFRAERELLAGPAALGAMAPLEPNEPS